MRKGILLIAIGHPNYIKMAINLAAGIKLNEPGMEIALATNLLPPAFAMERQLIDVCVFVPDEYFTTDGKTEYIKVKTRMYDLSPFDETIFLDVDMLWLHKRKPSELFTQLEGIAFTIANTGLAGSSIWADINEVKKAYKITDQKYYNFHSEFVYFKKCAAVKKYFHKVKEVYDHPKVKGTNFGGARIADELAFQIASMLLDYYPHQDNYLPTYWWGRDIGGKENHKFAYQLAEKYFSYSIGGNSLPTNVAKTYNQLAGFYFKKMGLANPWIVQNKKSFIPERKNI